MQNASQVDESGNPTIRFANAADAAALAELRYALRSTTGIATEPRAEFLDRCTAWMNDHLRDGRKWRCWWAEENEQVIGAIWVQLVEKIPNPRCEAEQHAYITNFFVQEAERGRGLGSRLLRTALEWCKSGEVHEVILWPT